MVGYTVSNNLTGTVFLWDYDRKDYQPSAPQKATLINNWLHDTGYIGWFATNDHYTQFLKFKDRESKVLFMMAFGVP
jgi:hypothetical protein